MSYAIIGAGNVGAALARHFARNGLSVSIANTRGPESLRHLVDELGDKVLPQTLEEAVKASVVILAVPFRSHAAVGALLPSWQGKIVVDAMNTYGVPVEELKGQASTDVVATAFPGARVVKTLNQLPAKLLAQDPVVNDGRRVMFVSSNDAAAEVAVAELVSTLGFSPILLGKIAEGGALIGMGGPLILQNLVKRV